MVSTMVEIQRKPRLGRVRLSMDRKVTPYAVQKGERLNNEIGRGVRNTFGLPAVISCQEGMTKFCDDCYASKIEDIPSVMDKMWHNWMTINKVINSSDELLRLFEPMVAECIDDFQRLLIPRSKWIFRHLWDGDIPSYAFLDALVQLATIFDDVQFWVYTRSFGYVSEWQKNDWSCRGFPENFNLYLSVDKYNVNRLEELRLWPEWSQQAGSVDKGRAKYAFCGETFQETELLAKSLGAKQGIKCPELTGRLDLVEWGNSETERGKRVGQGACAVCRWCVDGKGNVQFAVHPEPPNNVARSVG